MECDICLVEWDNKIHIPRMLNCGHTICELCLVNIFDTNKNKANILFCPSCMNPLPNIKKIEDIKNLIKNINLLRISEKIESKINLLTNSMTSLKNLGNIYSNKNNFNNKNFPEENISKSFIGVIYFKF